MLWNEFYEDDKAMILDLCDIMNAEFRELADAGCPLILVGEPPHHRRALRPDTTDAALRLMTEAISRQLGSVNAAIWLHTGSGDAMDPPVHCADPTSAR